MALSIGQLPGGQRVNLAASSIAVIGMAWTFTPWKGNGLHPGAVVYRRGDWMSLGGGANQLIASGVTDLGGGAPFYDQYVRLENDSG